MRRVISTNGALLLVGLLAVTLMTGCTRSRSTDRAKVLEAENINLRQKATTMEQQMRSAHVAQDDTIAREQQLRAELVAARQDGEAAEAARAQALAARTRLIDTQNDLSKAELALIESNRRFEALQRERIQPVQPAPRAVASRGGPTRLRMGGASPQAEAMRRDLQSQLSSYGVRGLKVEVRTDNTGTERVAIVLPDAFPSGKATLAYNASAVKAVISVGKMIKNHYPNSSVVVEGHTDSDPIRKSGWGTNENLSRARAGAVENLLTNSGVPARSVSTEGFGAARPLAQGNTKRAKSRNRRVEIFISPRS